MSTNKLKLINMDKNTQDKLIILLSITLIVVAVIFNLTR